MEIKKDKKGIYNYLIIDKVGYLEYLINDEVLDITDLLIYEDYRNKGYASTLINELFKMNTKKIMLEVREDNEKAINLYKKHGFKEISVRKKYYKDADALIMERYL